MDYSVIKINNNAIKSIPHNLDTASLLFALNFEESPCLLTTHNFGVLLSKYGKELKYFKKTDNTAHKLLKSVIKTNPNHKTFKELGDFYFIRGKHNLAINQYIEALRYKPHFLTSINLANCYFKINYYKEAINILEDVIKTTNIQKELLFDIYITLAFSQIFLQNKNYVLNIFTLLKSQYKPSPEIFKIAYYCDEYDYIIENYRIVMDNWFFDNTIFQIIYQAFLQSTNKCKLCDFLKWYCNEIDKFYSENTDFDISEKENFLTIAKHGPYTPNLNYYPQFVWQIDFMEE